MVGDNKVLLTIDDEPGLRRSIRHYFEDCGFIVFEASNGEQGIRLCREKKPDIVLTDLRMPEMDGLDVIKILHRELPDIPLIVVSGTGVLADAIAAIRQGAWDYVTKPIVEMEALEHVVATTLERVRLIEENRHYQSTLEDLVKQRTRELQAAFGDLQEREQAFRILSEGIGGITEDEIYRSIVRSCAQLLKTEYAAIGRLTDNDTIRGCACWEKGRSGKPLTYPLAGTPAAEAVCNGYCFYPSRVADNFPADEMLKTMDIQGYVGIVISDRNGKPLGVLTAFSPRSLELPEYCGELMEVLSSRAAAIIERQEADAIQKRLQEDLLQAQKMEAIGTLAGGIAHDFNNLLTPILGYSEMCLLDVAGNPQLRRRLNKIAEAAIRAKELVQQVLSISRKHEPKFGPVFVQAIAKEVMKMLRATLPATIQIRTIIQNDCPPVEADPTKIHQVIMNLCTNAFHALEEDGGILELSVEETAIGEGAGKIAPGNYIRIKVRDSGSGMHPSIVERIFEPYFTTKEEGKGTGLGLAVVHGIVTSYDGSISVDSTLGEGTTFTLLLPAKAGSRVDQQMTIARCEMPTGVERILLIDDQEAVLTVISSLFAELGYQTTAFENPELALKEFIDNPDGYDLVILDQTMPLLTGAEVAREMLRIRPSVPIILFTGYAVAEDMAGRDIAIRAIARKPMAMKKMAHLVRDVLDGKEGIIPSE